MGASHTPERSAIPSATDVLVVGSGVAGLCAALEAARGGCPTIVVESEREVGGASIHSGGACCIVGTPLQAQAGIEDSVELAFSDWRRCGGAGADLVWARRYLESSYEEVYRWCERLVRARETIVCAGGFVNAPELLSEHAPALDRIARVLCGGWRSARGLGLSLLSDAGAAFAALDRVWMYPVGTPNPADSSGRRGIVVRGLQDEIWVDRSGRRFHDETLRGGRSGIAALLSRPGQTCWGIFDVEEAAKLRLLDDERYGSARGSSASQQAAFFARSAHAWSDQPLTALAARLDLRGRTLAATVREYNWHVATGVDPDHGRDLRRARPIDETRACAIQYFPIAQKNLGGVLTDHNGRVLGPEGQPIPRLLAAGEVAGMSGGHINGDGALEGTMFGPSLFSGRVAGRTAAHQPSRR